MSYILVIEDDEFYAKIYQKKLAESGFKTKIFGDGTLALKEAQNDPPKLIVLDLVMPKMDGFLILNKLKDSEKLKDIPVVVLSNLSQDKDIEEAKKLGAIDYLVKTETSLNDAVAAIVRHYNAAK